MTWFRNNLRLLLIGFILLLGVTGVLGSFRASGAEESTFTSRPQLLANFTQNNVAVEISLIKNSRGETWLVGNFTPLLEGFHLYSKDIPKTGVEGQGFPTLFEIVMPSKVKPTGPLMADQSDYKRFNAVLGNSLPVYLDGPVTLQLPVQLPPNGKDVSADLSITYVTCSQQTCIAPVIDKIVSVLIKQ